MNTSDIPPRSEWKNLSLQQLYEVKTNMTNLYYDMRAINASFSNQYSKFISEIDVTIQRREAEMEAQD